MSNKSRFADPLASMREARANKPAAEPAEVATKPEPATARAGRGGKKNDPAYTQCNGYIPRELYKRVRLALIEDERELGELMEQLLSDWLAERERKG